MASGILVNKFVYDNLPSIGRFSTHNNNSKPFGKVTNIKSDEEGNYIISTEMNSGWYPNNNNWYPNNTSSTNSGNPPWTYPYVGHEQVQPGYDDIVNNYTWPPHTQTLIEKILDLARYLPGDDLENIIKTLSPSEKETLRLIISKIHPVLSNEPIGDLEI